MLITIEQALQLFAHDEVVAIPTETVYGLAAALLSEKAIAKIFQLKNRPLENPLIIHVKNGEECLPYLTEIPEHFHELATAFWPGPLTLVMPIDEARIPEIARAGLNSAGFRVPNHQTTLRLLEHISPIVAPSANLSGKPSSTTSQHVEEDFGASFPVIDGGPCKQGVESTILLFQDKRWYLGRKGAIPKEPLEAILGYSLEVASSKKPLCPGSHFRHYAPKARLHLSLKPLGKVVVGFSDRVYPNAKKIYPLSSSQDPETAAQSLYAVLRQLDVDSIMEADVDIAIPDVGLWHTLLERLSRAAES